MAQHREWDESRSPQWKYFLQRESAQRRKTRKEIEKEREITREEKQEWKEVIKDKRVLSKQKKTRLYVRINGELKEKLQKQNNTPSPSLEGE